MRRPRQLPRRDRFDYIIVGGGTAGCVLANRLSAEPSVSVLLLESGGRNENPLLRVPKGFYVTMREPGYTRRYPTLPLGPSGQVEAWLRGMGLGGTSAINGMVYTRGSADDYDALARAGNPGWDWAHMLPAFRAIENHQLAPSPQRGTGGPLPVTITAYRDRVIAAMLATATTMEGPRRVRDLNATGGERIGFSPATISRGRRVSAARAFLHPVRRRGNLVVRTDVHVGRVLFDGTRATGVRTRDAYGLVDHHARREVILSAGTIGSPQLLERSGIGQPDVLRRAGVEPRVASPHVGERVVEQRAVPLKARIVDGLGHNPRLDTTGKRLWAGATYLATGRGPLATPAYELFALLASSPDVAWPDIHLMLSPHATDASGLDLAPYPGLTMQGYHLRPTTHSSVHIGEGGEGASPVIDARFLETPEDKHAAAAVLRRARELLATPPLAELVVEETAPGPGVTSEDAIVRYALDAGGGIYHAVGSCAMGPDDDVVDHALRVRGVAGLRVVDASVYPVPPAGGTAAPVMALAWRAADLVREAAA